MPPSLFFNQVHLDNWFCRENWEVFTCMLHILMFLSILVIILFLFFKLENLLASVFYFFVSFDNLVECLFFMDLYFCYKLL